MYGHPSRADFAHDNLTRLQAVTADRMRSARLGLLLLVLTLGGAVTGAVVLWNLVR